jgi:hypothetical protein
MAIRLHDVTCEKCKNVYKDCLFNEDKDGNIAPREGDIPNRECKMGGECGPFSKVLSPFSQKNHSSWLVS